MWPNRSWVECVNLISVPASNAPANAAQDPICLRCCRGTLLTCAHLVVHQVTFSKAAPQPHRSQPILGSLVSSSQVQHFVLVFIKLHKIVASPLFQPIQIFLLDASHFWGMHFTIQFGVICKLGKDAVNLIIQVIYGDIEQRGAQYESLGHPTCRRLPTWVKNIDHHLLSVIYEPISHPFCRSSVQSIACQFV